MQEILRSIHYVFDGGEVHYNHPCNDNEYLSSQNHGNPVDISQDIVCDVYEYQDSSSKYRVFLKSGTKLSQPFLTSRDRPSKPPFALQ